MLGYLEINRSTKNMKIRTLSGIKSVLSNVHKNYLTLLEFLNNSISEMSNDKMWVISEKIVMVLNERSTYKLHYKCPQSEILKRNNDMSLNILKQLIKTYPDQNIFIKFAVEVIKNIENLKVSWVMNKIRELLDELKESKVAFHPQSSKLIEYSQSENKTISKVCLVNTNTKNFNTNPRIVSKHYTPQRFYSKRDITGEVNKDVKNELTPAQTREKKMIEFQKKQVKSLSINL
jgi:hypothetical protein